MKARRFPEFDGLRAAAALMVFSFHAWFGGLPIGDRIDWSTGPVHSGLLVLDFSLENLGVQGVALFYVISGFLLYRPFLAARASGRQRPGIPGYLIRRGVRIFPAYWAAVTIIGLVLGSRELFSLKGIWDYYLLNHIYSFDTLYGNPVPSAWTLGVELSFYGFLALWVFVVGRLLPVGAQWFKREILLLTVLALFSFGWLVWVLVDPATRPHAFQPKLVALPANLYVFAAGMALAAISVRLIEGGAAEDSRPARLASFLARRGWLIALGGLTLLAVASWRFGFDSEGWALRVFIDSILKVVTAVGLVSPAVFRIKPEGLPLRVLGSRVVLYLGLVSYGIYIWQLFVMQQLFRDDRFGLGLPTLWAFPAAALLALAVTTLIATASWYLLEKPVIRWGAALSGRASRRARSPI